MVGNPLRWLGGKIDIKVEVETLLEGGGVWDSEESGQGWDEATWALFAWTDITEWVEDLWISRGQPRWDARFRAGSLTLKLNNITGLFTPGVGPELDAIAWRPGRGIRVFAYPDPTDPDDRVPLFTGRIDDTRDTFEAISTNVVATVRALDALGDMHAFNPPMLETLTGVQATDVRVSTALDRMGWPFALRDLQAGAHTVQTSTLAQTTLEECQRAAEAEGGALWADTENRVVFKARDWLTTDAHAVDVQGHLGYTSEQEAGVPYAPIVDASTSWETARIRNDVQFARVGGDAYRAQNTDSQVLYGRRTYQRFDFLCNTDAQVEFLADRYVLAYKDLRLRVDSVSVAANADPDNEDLNRLFYAIDFGDLLQVRLDTGRGWSIEREGHVIGVDHHITPDDWNITYTLDDAALAVEEESS